MRRSDLGKREATVDDRPEAAVGEGRQQLLGEALGQRRLLLERPGPQHGADERRPLHHQLAQRQRRTGLAHGADLHDAALQGERIEVEVEILPADHIQHGIDATAAGHLAHRGQHVAAAVVDGSIGAEGQAAVDLAGGTGDHHPGAGPAGNLDRRRAHAGCAAVHQRHAPGAQPALQHQGVPRGEPHLGDRRGVRHVDPDGHRDRLPFVDGDLRGVAAAGQDSHHRVADLPGGHPGTDRADPPGELQARDLVFGLWPRLRVATDALEEIGAVDRSGRDVDDDLLRPGLQVRQLLYRHDLGPAVPVQHHRAHDASWSRDPTGVTGTTVPRRP